MIPLQKSQTSNQTSDYFDSAEDAFDNEEFDYRARIVDSGIGAYEYWGAPGRDVQLDLEVEGDGEADLTWATESGEDLVIPSKLVTARGYYETSYKIEITGELKSVDIEFVGKLWVVNATYSWTAR
jgi:hypothetical protein